MGQAGSAAAAAAAAAKRGHTDDVKRQVDSDVSKRRAIYQLVDVKTGGGRLIELVKQSARRKSLALDANGSSARSFEAFCCPGGPARVGQHTSQEEDGELSAQIRALVEPLLYEQGRGKPIALSQLWRARFNLELEHAGGQVCEVCQEEGPDDNSSRLVCWRLDERGFVGETALHICFLLATPSHMILAQKLLELFPMLIHDVYTCNEYFGESCLHMAIVNEDIRVVKWLLARGAQLHQRCLGSFFLPLDQREAWDTNERARRWLLEQQQRQQQRRQQQQQLRRRRRRHSAGGAHACMPEAELAAGQPDWLANQFGLTNTNYDGHCYWGEFPLSFAASLGLADCYRLLLAYGADPNRRDSNGNSTLHICVIVDRVDMFDLCFATGAKLDQLNGQRLTPLALAAKLERVQMFFHILAISREASWMLCQVCFQQVALAGLDSIDSRDGSIDDNSLLCIVVSGSSNAHLSMLDGLLSELLEVKWNSSIRLKFRAYLASYLLFLAVASLAQLARLSEQLQQQQHRGAWSLSLGRAEVSLRALLELALVGLVLGYLLLLAKRLLEPDRRSSRRWARARERAHLLLAQAPEVAMFSLTCLLVLLCVPLRLARLEALEASLAASVIFLLPLKLLFFCRASRSLGSFVVMIYRILMNDVLCFVALLVIFVAGFSQSFFIIFQTHRPTGGGGANSTLANPAPESYFANLFDALISMHMMALNEFSLVLDQFDATDFPVLARLLFCLYMILVSILLVNMLIAMLGKTYQDISSQPNESVRQWARALLAVERMCSPASRLAMLDQYSQPVGELAELGAPRKRVYNSTMAMDEQQVLELNSIKQLIEQNRASCARAAAAAAAARP